jgi:membrane protein
MRKLLRFEFRKLFRQKSFYSCNILLLIFIFLSAVISKVVVDNAEELTVPLPTTFEMVRSALQGGNVILILGVFTALFVCSDYTDGTMKNIYAKGYGRTNVYFSELIAVITFSFIVCIVSWGGGFVFGKMFFEIGEGLNGNLFGTLISQMLVVFSYTGLFFALSTVIKKTGASIASCIVAPIIFSLLFTAVDSIIGNETFSLSNYWLDGFFEKLTQNTVMNNTLLVAAVFSVLYAVIFILIGWFINRKSEI